jgi:ABC-2 type transport system permease protein
MMLSLATSLTELPEYRRVLGTLIARDLKVKYQTKALGFVWSLLYPALMIAIWYVVFKRIVRLDIADYWAFLISGMLPFQFVQSAISEGSGAVRRNAGLIRKVYVPMEVLVIAGVTVKLVEFLMQLAVAIALLLAFHHARGEVAHISLWRAIFTLPLAISLLYVFALGAALPLAAWSVIYRDLEHMISLAMLALMYLTPVFWSVSLVADKWWVKLFALNPVLHLIELFRGPLYWGAWPANAALGHSSFNAWAVAMLFSVLFFVGGYTLFDRSKHILAEVV